MNCIFCEIAEKIKPASLIAESDRCIAFLDHEPFALGHTLVIPKAHMSDLPQMPHEVLAEMLHIAQQRAEELRGTILADKVVCSGTTLYMADGVGAQPHLPHLHLHIVPRYIGDAKRWQQWFSELPVDALAGR